MNETQEALKILVEAVNLAQSRGAYNFDEAVIVKKAIDTFTKPAEPVIQTEEPVTVEPVAEVAPKAKKNK